MAMQAERSSKPVQLNAATLASLPAGVAVPLYDRAQVTPGIMHFGVGNFHRAHQAVYLDRLFNQGKGLDWGIVGAGVMDHDRAMRDALAAQDYLSTVVEQSASASTARVTAVMVDYCPVADAPAIIARLADPAIRIVSLTVTEGGYFIDASTNSFDVNHPAIVEDAANRDDPKTVFGLIIAGLKARRAAGHAPFTVMSCDNIPHNGIVARETVVGLARMSDPDFATWIADNVAFPNSMVDRITPATSERERAILLHDFGIEDASPVFCEDFIQWVLEDNFPAGRPPLEDVGVEFVKDVTPYELMKIRILNGGHASIAYPAGLLDIQYVHEAMEHPLVLAFLDKLENTEIIPAVPPVLNTDLTNYFSIVKERCANPKIADTIRRLCLDGSNRQPKFIIPTIADRLKAGQSVDGLALESALWCRYCYGETDSGAKIEPNDPSWDRLVDVAHQAKSNPTAWVDMADIYGDVGWSERFRDAFAFWLGRLWAKGTADTLSHYLKS